MTFRLVAAALEVAIIVGSGIDAYYRESAHLGRWFWWHLAPLWYPWRLLASALMAAAMRIARASYERHAVAHTDGALVAVEDRWPE